MIDRPPAAAPATRAGTADETCRLDQMVTRFAILPAGAAERLLDAYVRQAVADWRVADAAFWHRVKFRARLARPARHGGPGRMTG